MGSINFRSVGKTRDQVNTETQATTASLTPIGLKTPLQFGQNSEGVFAMHFSLADQLHDNLRNLILTNWGERVALYDFGANLRELVTELTNLDDFDNEATKRIAQAIAKWMPYVQPQTFTSSVDNNDNQNTAVVHVRITYDIPLLNITGKVLVVTLYAIG